MNEHGLHPSLRPYPSKLFVEVTTRCNLRCPICVKESAGQGIAEGDLGSDLFARLAPALPRLETLVLNGIGEPLLHPLLPRFVEEARRAMPESGWIGFQTNGQLLSAESARALSQAGVDRICISTEGESRAPGALRVGGERARIEAAAAALVAEGRRRGRPIALGVEFVAMRENVRRLPELVRWAARNHVSFVIVTHVLPYDEATAALAAFDPMSDRARELHDRWRARAAAEGVDLRQALRAFVLKKGYGRMSPGDQRIVDFYLEMVARASEQDVCMKIGRLMSREDDGPLLGSVREAFAEAEEVARREGVELRLPAAVPSRARRCDFVEEGGAFVSWGGDVHPCYFLWHRYTSHVGGLAKRVEPLSFGNLADADVLEIWNGAAARAFREAVRKYDYPFCYDCTFALCDHQQGPEFEQDCYASAVPCGACLWSMGVFQCLR